MIGYVTLGTDDLERARAFYDALLKLVGAKRLMQLPDEDGGFTLYGRSMREPALVVTRPFNKQPQHCGNGNMVAIVFDSRDKVDAFHARALELGATDEGAPGFRGEPELGYYFAYFRDLDGNKLAAFNIAPQAQAAR